MRVVTSTYAGRPRVFGKPGKRSVVLDDEANIGQIVELLNRHFQDGELLHLGVSNLRNSDFSFLQDLPFLQNLSVNRCYGSSIAAVESCHDLRFLSLSDDYGEVDLAALPNLETLLVAEWRHGIRGLQSLSKLLRFRVHKAKMPSVAQLELPPAIRDVALVETSIESLAGISDLKSLRSLHVAYAPKLVSLYEVDLLPNLRRLSLSHLKGLMDYDGLKRCDGLREVEMSHCTAMQSIEWVRSLRELRVFWLVGTDVVDGNLSSLLQHDALLWSGGTGKKHFTPSMKEVEAHARQRRLSMGFDTKAEAARLGLLPAGVAMTDDDWVSVA